MDIPSGDNFRTLGPIRLDVTKDAQRGRAFDLISEAMQADKDYGQRKARIMCEAATLMIATEDGVVRESLAKVFERWGR